MANTGAESVQETAEALAMKAERYDALETALLEGDIFSALQQLNGKHSSESFGRLVDTFLPTLRELSFEMYCRATRPVLENIILTTHDYAKRVGDQNLKQAAYYLYRHLLATEQERQDTDESVAFARGVMAASQSLLGKLVDDRIQDPDNKLNAFTRRAVVKEALADLDLRFEQDEELVATIRRISDSGWRDGFRDAHKEAILSVRLSRAKPLIPGILNRIVADALGVQADAAASALDWNLASDVDFRHKRAH